LDSLVLQNNQSIRKGWLNNNYLTLFADVELETIAQRYALEQILPGYTIQISSAKYAPMKTGQC
jgi:hypothetical protein